jgi:hypothetical protein
MKNILSKLFEKRGIKDEKELTQEEQATVDSWKKILSKEELSLADIKEFCQSQCEIIEARWRDYDIDTSKKANLIPFHTIYKTLLVAIDSPKVAREALEQQLIELTK